MPQAAALCNLPLILALLAHPPANQVPTGSARAQFDKGVSLQKQGKYDDAIRVLDGASKLDAPPALAAEIQVELAESHFRKGKAAFEGHVARTRYEPSMRTAASLFEEVVERYPQVTDQAALAAYMTGSSHLMLGDMQRALEHYQKAYKSFPTSKHRPKALLRTGVCQAGLGDPRKAQATYRRFIADYPKDSAVPKVKQYVYQMGIVGKKAPTIRASRWLNGTIARGLPDLNGEVVVVVFFATWCKQCENELPHLKREIQRWTREGVFFLGIADPEDPKAEQPVDFYVQKNQIDFLDVALDRGGRSWAPYRVTGLPAAAVIDRNGVVRWRGHFAFFSHTLIERLLRE